MKWILRWLRDIYLHLGPGLLCALRGHHRASVTIGDYVRKGFRPVPLYQCPKCFAFFMREADVLRVGGKKA